MSEFEDIQRLIRLKRFEQPGEGFTEDFVREFQQRQRAEMLKQSSIELLWERINTWWGNLMVPKWGLAAAVAVICLMSGWMLIQPAPATSVTAVPATVPVIEEKPFIPKMDLSDLPMAQIMARNDAELEDILLRKHLEVRPALEGTVPSALPAASEWQNPSLQRAIPAIHDGADGGLGR
ncbi:MAG: hypothetical protein U1F71_07175 [Verrucomicrobiaceae bacterium]